MPRPHWLSAGAWRSHSRKGPHCCAQARSGAPMPSDLRSGLSGTCVPDYHPWASTINLIVLAVKQYYELERANGGTGCERAPAWVLASRQPQGLRSVNGGLLDSVLTFCESRG